MGELIDKAKKEFLESMYHSVERMNEHALQGNDEGVLAEQTLQTHLRKNFEDLQTRE